MTRNSNKHKFTIDKNRIDLLVSFLILFIPNVIMWIILFPGYLQPDHQDTIISILNGQPSEWHSLVWGYIFFAGILLFRSYGFAGFLQSLIFAIFILVGIHALKRYNIIKREWVFSLIMALFPTFLMYNQLYASDIIFAYSLFTLTCLLACFVKVVNLNHCNDHVESSLCVKKFRVLNKDTEQVECGYHIHSLKKNYAKLSLLITFFMIIACLMRKNAIVLPVVLIIISFICLRKKAKFLIWSSCITLIISLFLPFVLDNLVGAQKSPSQEILSVPSVQIAASYKYGNVPEDCREIFESYHSSEDWVSKYSEFCADPTKSGLMLNFDFLRAWIKTGLNNKTIYLKAHLKLIYQFFDFGTSGMLIPNGDFNGMWCDFNEFDEEKALTALNLNNDFNTNYYNSSNMCKNDCWKSLKWLYSECVNSQLGIINFLARCLLFNRGLPFWVLLCAFIVSIFNKRLKSFMVYASPCIAIFLTLIFFAPVALFRYAVTLYYTIFVISYLGIARKGKLTIKIKNLSNKNID